MMNTEHITDGTGSACGNMQKAWQKKLQRSMLIYGIIQADRLGIHSLKVPGGRLFFMAARHPARHIIRGGEAGTPPSDTLSARKERYIL